MKGELRQWEEGEVKQADYKNHRLFTSRCISNGLVPLSVRLNSNRRDISNKTRNILRAERQLLQDRVKCINGILQDNKVRIVSSKSRLFTLVTNNDIQLKCEKFIRKVSELKFNMVRQRQINKLNILVNKSKNKDSQEVRQANQHSTINNRDSQAQVGNNDRLSHSASSNNNKWVINLSRVPLTPAQVSLLSKGPNFALAPSNHPNVELISGIESICHKLSE